MIKNLKSQCGNYTIQCLKADGSVRWSEDFSNMVVDQGLQHELDVVFKGATASSTWYFGLLNASPTIAAGLTLSTLSEFTGYTGSRKEFTSVRTLNSLSNTASKATFEITQASSVIGGVFLTNALSGTTGVLFSAATFPTADGNRSAEVGDTLTIGYTLSSANQV